MYIVYDGHMEEEEIVFWHFEDEDKFKITKFDYHSTQREKLNTTNTMPK